MFIGLHSGSVLAAEVNVEATSLVFKVLVLGRRLLVAVICVPRRPCCPIDAVFAMKNDPVRIRTTGT